VSLCIGGLAQKAHAQQGTTDTMTVTVTPTVTYSVAISSPYASGYDFSNVALSATTVSTKQIVLNASGATGSEYFGLAISNTSGGWTPTASAPGADNFRMAAYFQLGQPSSTTFTGSGTNYLGTTFSPPAYNLYNQTTRTTPGSASTNLWLRLEMPTQITTGGTGQQTMTMTATASGT
jgi:hypothetical protein